MNLRSTVAIFIIDSIKPLGEGYAPTGEARCPWNTSSRYYLGIEKRQIVDDDDDRDNFVTRLGRLAAETGTIIYAWTLMTNHAHILLRSSQPGLSGYMRRLLTGYAVTYNRRHQRHGLRF